MGCCRVHSCLRDRIRAGRRRERLLASILTAPKDAPKQALLPKRPEDDSSRSRVSKCQMVQGGWASGDGNLVREGQQVEEVKPRPRWATPWESRPDCDSVCHAWTDGWVITRDDQGAEDPIAQGGGALGTK